MKKTTIQKQNLVEKTYLNHMFNRVFQNSDDTMVILCAIAPEADHSGYCLQRLQT